MATDPEVFEALLDLKAGLARVETKVDALSEAAKPSPNAGAIVGGVAGALAGAGMNYLLTRFAGGAA